MPSEISEYKNNPVIKLFNSADDKHPFTFGLTKAKLILDNFDAIKEFVEENREEENND